MSEWIPADPHWRVSFDNSPDSSAPVVAFNTSHSAPNNMIVPSVLAVRDGTLVAVNVPGGKRSRERPEFGYPRLWWSSEVVHS